MRECFIFYVAVEDICEFLLFWFLLVSNSDCCCFFKFRLLLFPIQIVVAVLNLDCCCCFQLGLFLVQCVVSILIKLVVYVLNFSLL